MTTPQKRTGTHGMPWETEYGYAQAVQVGDTIYVAGQVSHDDAAIILGEGSMETQMRQAYRNAAKILADFDATLDHVVDEILFVTDMETAFAARAKMKGEMFAGTPSIASTIAQIQRLAMPQLMVEIRLIAKV
jgi:2-iminobutanoate/2-iminopropanoate deaminase